MSEERFFLYDESEETETRFVSFMGEQERFDLAIVKTARFFGKSLVLNIQNGRFAIIGHDDLSEEGYIEEAFDMEADAAEELRDYLQEVVRG